MAGDATLDCCLGLDSVLASLQGSPGAVALQLSQLDCQAEDPGSSAAMVWWTVLLQ